jgi:stearoyl-CoA desaturase (delta-9 desaturase)
MPSWQIVTTSIVLIYLTGLGVTMGYHRLYSHNAYKINPVVETIVLFFGTMGTQGSVLRWSFDHRYHHAFVDTDKDPYSIKKGFWYAHFLWLLEKPKPIENKIVADLLKNPLLRFQHRFYGLLMFGINLLVTLFFGWYYNDYLGAFLFVWIVRMFFLHHFTWFINSLAHTWGDRPFCESLSAVDNYLISLLTWGEGYHNYHHTFGYDYRNGVRWYHYDPTKWLIWTLSKLGLATRLKKKSGLCDRKKDCDRT